MEANAQPVPFQAFRHQVMAAAFGHVGVMSLCVGSVGTLRTAILAIWAGRGFHEVAYETAHAFMHPGMVLLPLAIIHFKASMHLLHLTCILCHLVRSFALMAAGMGWAPLADGLRVVLARRIELCLELAVVLQDQMGLPTMALLHAVRQLGWMCVLVQHMGASWRAAVLRGLVNWAVMMGVSTLMELRNRRQYMEYCNQLALRRSHVASSAPLSEPQSPRKPQKGSCSSAPAGDCVHSDAAVPPAPSAPAPAPSAAPSTPAAPAAAAPAVAPSAAPAAAATVLAAPGDALASHQPSVPQPSGSDGQVHGSGPGRATSSSGLDPEPATPKAGMCQCMQPAPSAPPASPSLRAQPAPRQRQALWDTNLQSLTLPATANDPAPVAPAKTLHVASRLAGALGPAAAMPACARSPSAAPCPLPSSHAVAQTSIGSGSASLIILNTTARPANSTATAQPSICSAPALAATSHATVPAPTSGDGRRPATSHAAAGRSASLGARLAQRSSNMGLSSGAAGMWLQEPEEACGSAAYSHRDAYHSHSWLMPCETGSLLDGLLTGPVGVDDAELPLPSMGSLSAPTSGSFHGPASGRHAPVHVPEVMETPPSGRASFGQSSTFSSAEEQALAAFGRVAAAGKLPGYAAEGLKAAEVASALPVGPGPVAPPQVQVVRQLMKLVAADKQQPYVSRQQQATVRVKMRGMEPQQLPSDLTLQLQSYIQQRDPHLLVRGVCVRRGCVVLTLSLLVLDEGGDGAAPSEAAGEKLAEDVAQCLSCLLRGSTVLRSSVPPGATLSVQTDSRLLLGHWDSSAGRYQLPSSSQLSCTASLGTGHSSPGAAHSTSLPPAALPAGRLLSMAPAVLVAPVPSGPRSSCVVSLALQLQLPLGCVVKGWDEAHQRPLSPSARSRGQVLPGIDPCADEMAAAQESERPCAARRCSMGAAAGAEMGLGAASRAAADQLLAAAHPALHSTSLQPAVSATAGEVAAGAAAAGQSEVFLLARTCEGTHLRVVVAQQEDVPAGALGWTTSMQGMQQLNVQVELEVPAAALSTSAGSPALPVGITMELWSQLQLPETMVSFSGMPLEVLLSSAPLVVFPDTLAPAAHELQQHVVALGGVAPSHMFQQPTMLHSTAAMAASHCPSDTEPDGAPASLQTDIGLLCSYLRTAGTLDVAASDGGADNSRCLQAVDCAQAQHAAAMRAVAQDLLDYAVRKALGCVAELLVEGLQHWDVLHHGQNQAGSVPDNSLEAAGPAGGTGSVGTTSSTSPSSWLVEATLGLGSSASLLHAAMLSDSPCTLQAVLRWGLRYGGPAWTWPWACADAAGCTPLHVLALQPQAAAMLHALTDTLPPQEQAAAQRVWMEEQGGLGMAPVQLYAMADVVDPSAHVWPHAAGPAPGHSPTAGRTWGSSRGHSCCTAAGPSLSALAAIPQGSTDGEEEESCGRSTQPSSITSCSGSVCAGAAASSKETPPWVVARALQLLSQWGRAVRQLLSADSPEYRVWVTRQLRPIVVGWCSCMTLMLGACLVRSARMGELAQDYVTLLLCMGGYLPMAIAVHRTGEWQAWSLPICMMRSTSWLLASWGVIHVPQSWANILTKHVEVVHEVLLVSVVEEMRVRDLLLGRLALWAAYASAYHSLGHTQPLLRSLLLNGCGVLVSLASRAWQSHTFLQARSRAPQHTNSSPASCLRAMSSAHSSKACSFEAVCSQRQDGCGQPSYEAAGSKAADSELLSSCADVSLQGGHEDGQLNSNNSCAGRSADAETGSSSRCSATRGPDTTMAWAHKSAMGLSTAGLVHRAAKQHSPRAS